MPVTINITAELMIESPTAPQGQFTAVINSSSHPEYLQQTLDSTLYALRRCLLTQVEQARIAQMSTPSPGSTN